MKEDWNTSIAYSRLFFHIISRIQYFYIFSKRTILEMHSNFLIIQNKKNCWYISFHFLGSNMDSCSFESRCDGIFILLQNFKKCQKQKTIIDIVNDEFLWDEEKIIDWVAKKTIFWYIVINKSIHCCHDFQPCSHLFLHLILNILISAFFLLLCVYFSLP